MISSAKLVKIWQTPHSLPLDATDGLPAYLFYGIAPAVLFLINLLGIKVILPFIFLENF